jgi:hypothetical protein
MLSSVFRRVGAWGALAAFAASFALPILSTRHLVPDVDEGSRLAVHAEQQVGMPEGTGADEHCAVCHWMRAVAGASAPAVAVFATWLPPAEPVATGSPDRQGRTAVPAVPSRAPPARLA